MKNTCQIRVTSSWKSAVSYSCHKGSAQQPVCGLDGHSVITSDPAKVTSPSLSWLKTGQNNLPIFEPLYSSPCSHTYVCTRKHTVTTLTCTRLQKGYHLRKTSRLHSVCLFAFVITVWRPSLPSLSSQPRCQSPNTVLYASFFGAILSKHKTDPDLLILC